MSLFIQNDTGGAGSGSVFPLNASANLMQIAEVATTDAVYGENPQPAPSDLIQVTYTQNTAAGPCPTRLNLLVNTAFPLVPGDPVDIIIVPVDNSFTLLDGGLIGNTAGITLPVGNSDNPTESVMVIYDTSDDGGSGYCVGKEGGGNVCFPPAVIVYHELSHALRTATATSLSLAATGCDASPEENAAETDENDMRDVLGIPHRDTTNHCGGPGCPSSNCTPSGSCCIVASIASGSPYSAEVNALRDVRDGLLRRSEIGFQFFEQLHYDYYGFSPEVCRLMAVSPALQRQIEIYFVKPLTRCLRLMQDCLMAGLSAEELGSRFEASLEASPELRALTAPECRRALAVVAGGAGDELPDEPLWEELRRHLDRRARTSPFVRWALMDSIALYVQAVLWRREGMPIAEVGGRLKENFERWGADLPLTEGWKSLSQYALREELGFLGNALLRSAEHRERFGRRLFDHLGRAPAATALLEEAGYLPQGGRNGE